MYIVKGLEEKRDGGRRVRFRSCDSVPPPRDMRGMGSRPGVPVNNRSDGTAAGRERH